MSICYIKRVRFFIHIIPASFSLFFFIFSLISFSSDFFFFYYSAQQADGSPISPSLYPASHPSLPHPPRLSGGGLFIGSVSGRRLCLSCVPSRKHPSNTHTHALTHARTHTLAGPPFRKRWNRNEKRKERPKKKGKKMDLRRERRMMKKETEEDILFWLNYTL